MIPIIDALGLGGQLLAAATLLVTAWYIYRVVGLARIAGALVGSLAGYTLVILVVLAIVVALGWVDPRPSTMLEHGRTAWSFATGRGVDLLRGILEAVEVW